MKIRGIIFDVGQTLSNQLDKERLVERNKKYYAYVYSELMSRNISSHFPSLSHKSSEDFVEDLNTLNLSTRAEKNISTEVLKEYRMSEQTLDILISYERAEGRDPDRTALASLLLPEIDQIFAGTEALDEGVYELWPDTKETLEELRRLGYVLSLASNTAHPVKHEHMLARLGITPLIDHFAVSSYIGVRKPNPEMVRILLEKMQMQPSEVIVVGDLLDRDILMGNLAGTRTVWINAIPYSLEQNLKRITEGDAKYLPTAGIVALSQLLPTIEYLDNIKEDSQQVKVGYYFPHLRKKMETGKQKAFVSGPRVSYLPIELRAPIENLGKFDVIVHKITDIMLSGAEEDLQAVQNLKSYIKRNPNVVLLDPLEGLEFTNNRRAFVEAWKPFVHNSVNVRCPRLYNTANIEFPCILKTEVACQVKGSHDMCIALSQEIFDKASAEFSLPFIIQEWISHDAMFKVYILGNYHQVSPQRILSSDSSITTFNSAKMPEGLTINTDAKLDEEVIQRINEEIHKLTGLGLVSYDLAIDSRSGDYILIDLNYFPGYYTVPNYKDLMDSYILNSVSTHN